MGESGEKIVLHVTSSTTADDALRLLGSIYGFMESVDRYSLFSASRKAGLTECAASMCLLRVAAAAGKDQKFVLKLTGVRV